MNAKTALALLRRVVEINVARKLKSEIDKYIKKSERQSPPV